MKTVRRHLHYGSIPNWPNFYKQVSRMRDNQARYTYADYDPTLGEKPTEEQAILLKEFKPDMPTIELFGSEKLHGENMAVCYSRGEIWVQGRNSIRTVLGDQNGMAQFVEERKPTFQTIFNEIAETCYLNTDEVTIVLDGEWAGGNIQRGNAACSGTDKGFYLFDLCRVISNEDDEVLSYVSTFGIENKDHSIYNMAEFGRYTITLDLNDKEGSYAKLEAMMLSIEEKSPIAAYFEKPDNVGEGVLFHTVVNDKVLRLKVKGEKHGGKPKTPKPPKDPKRRLTSEQAKLLDTIAGTVTPVWRLNQAITETNSTEMKQMGEVIKWVLADIVKEDLDVITDAKLTLKEVQSTVVAIIRDYYTNHLNTN